ncbi:MAG: DUF192 domain-containing protein [Candidatus Pacearchaeota archaeon]
MESKLNKKRNLAVSLAVIFLIISSIGFAILSLMIKSNFKENKKYPINSREICFNKSQICFNTEIADTENERKIGLMSREYLEENKGMLFIFHKEDKYGFWMKDVLIPLDIIWINSDLEVVHIEKNVLPCKSVICNTYFPDKNSLYVLEINGNLTEKNIISIGDKIIFR